jgi:hydrogenase/urease accessory protein HupE
MKKIILRIVFPFLVGFGVLIALGLPIGQALFTGICAITGMYIGQYFSKSRAEKKMKG